MIDEKNIKFIVNYSKKYNITLDFDINNKLNFIRLHMRCISYFINHNMNIEITKASNNLISSNILNKMILRIFIYSFIKKNNNVFYNFIFNFIYNRFRNQPLFKKVFILNYIKEVNIKLYLSNITNKINILKHTIFNKNISIDNSTIIEKNVSIIADGKFIKIGKNSVIRETARLRLHGGSIEIGEGVYINAFSMIYGHGGLKIGNHVLIASHVSIIPANHMFNDLTKPISFQPESRKGIIIEDDVWIGTGVRILDGVCIGKGSIVGAGSVVTKSTENYSINVGIPAKKIKSRIKKYNEIKSSTLRFLSEMKSKNSNLTYRFAFSQSQENLYSTVYSFLVKDIFNEIKNISPSQKEEYIKYFNSFQNPTDGLWYDKKLQNNIYNDTDWWGARHLAIHMIAVYSALGVKPKYKITYVEKYYDINFLKNWLDKENWNSYFQPQNDIDNKIMNIGVILQYNRDTYKDKKAELALNYLYDYLYDKINKNTGLWGVFDIKDAYKLSRSIQFAYHLYRLYFYDNKDIKFKDKILNLTLKTQNLYGGFSPNLDSSACEDIDSLELLIFLSNKNDEKTNSAIKKALIWVLSNQNEDGGFVFRKNQKLKYGHDILSSNKNESNIFATWFRVLSILKIYKFLDYENDFNYTKIPGY